CPLLPACCVVVVVSCWKDNPAPSPRLALRYAPAGPAAEHGGGTLTEVGVICGGRSTPQRRSRRSCATSTSFLTASAAMSRRGPWSVLRPDGLLVTMVRPPAPGSWYDRKRLLQETSPTCPTRTRNSARWATMAAHTPTMALLPDSPAI